MDFVFDPRVFISPPYRTCPKCSQAAFGVLSIAREQYTRRCRECWFTETYPFWSTLKKRVIYVDQFAISNMMKAIDVSAKAHDKAAADPFWIQLFERLERVWATRRRRPSLRLSAVDFETTGLNPAASLPERKRLKLLEGRTLST